MASSPRLHIVPSDPGPDYPRTGYCNDQDRDCRIGCGVDRCPHGKALDPTERARQILATPNPFLRGPRR